MSTLGATLERPVNLGAPLPTDFVPELREPALGVPRIPGDAGIPPPEPPLRPSLTDLLGLPEHTLTEKTYEEKLANVTEFVSERLSEIDFGFFDKSHGKRNREDFEQRLRVQKEEKLSLRAKFDRKLLLWKMGRSNISNPEEVLQFFEDHLPVYDYDYRNISPESLTGLIGKSKEENRSDVFSRIDQGIKRLVQLNIPPGVYNLDMPNFPEIIQELTEISDEKFQEIYQEINKYTFLDDIFYLGGGDKISDDAAALIDIFKNGGLTQQQKALLDKQQFYMQLTGRTPSKTNHSTPNTFDFSMDISKAFDAASFSRIDEFLPYVVDFADWKLTTFPELDKNKRLIDSNFLDTLEYLRTQNALPYLQLISKQGFSPYSLYDLMERAYNREKVERVKEILDQASQFGVDEEKMRWVKTVQGVFAGDSKLHPSQLANYEVMYANKETLQNLALILHELPNPNPDADIYWRNNERIVRVDKGKVEIDYYNLADRIVEVAAASESDKFANLLQRLLNQVGVFRRHGWNRSPVGKDDLSFYAYIAEQKGNDWEKSIDQYENIKASVIEGAQNAQVLIPEDMLQSAILCCADWENFSPPFVMKNFSGFKTGRFISLIQNFSDDQINSLSTEDQTFMRFVRPLHGSVVNFFIGNKDKFSEFVKDGKLTPAFFEFSVETGNYSLLPISQLLTEDAVASFPDDKKEFWEVYKSLQTRIEQDTLVQSRDKFNEMFINGKPTSNFLLQVVKGKYLEREDINTILGNVDLSTFTVSDRAFWEYYRLTTPIIRLFIAENKSSFFMYVENGKPTLEFVNEFAKRNPDNLLGVLKEADIKSFPEAERDFWDYFRNANPAFHSILLRSKNRFNELIVNGRETPLLYQELAQLNPREFIEIANKDMWKAVIGEDTLQKFLDSLPKRTDEKRNAFTHNKYDRTTEFIRYLLDTRSINFGLHPDNFTTLAEFVEQFGFAKNEYLYRYFIYLYNLAHGKIDELPLDIIESGITSIEDLKTKLTELSRKVYSKTPLVDLSEFSNFEKEMLKVVTGKATHRFDSGNPSMEKIIEDFKKDMEAGEIKPLPEGYKTESLDVSNVRIEFDAKAIQNDFDTLSKEILGAIQNPNDISSLLTDLRNMLQSKAAELERLVTTAQGGKQAHMLKDRDLMREYFEKLADVPDADGLLVALLDMRFSDTNQQKIINSIFRRIIFGKVFRKHFSPGFIQEIQTQLESGLNAGSIETVINIIDEMAKTHALNMNNSNQEGYWTDEAYQAITKSRRGNDLPHSFNPHIGKLKEAVKQFQIIKTGSGEVEVIPDRGFVGEMSGYLADVCYTAEYPLLKKWPNVVPYKFVRQNSQTGEPEFIGSVLVFSVTEAEGNPSLLIRAFDVPDETSIDIRQFIEGFLDNVVTPVAVATGKRQILIPGNLGAVSNYQMTMNHMREQYINGKSPISLAENFNFNNYDLTKNCYVARVIQ